MVDFVVTGSGTYMGDVPGGNAECGLIQQGHYQGLLTRPFIQLTDWEDVDRGGGDGGDVENRWDRGGGGENRKGENGGIREMAEMWIGETGENRDRGERENEGYPGDEENGGDRGGNRTSQGKGGCDNQGEDGEDSEEEEDWEVTPTEEEQKGKPQAVVVSFSPLPEPQQALCIRSVN